MKVPLPGLLDGLSMEPVAQVETAGGCAVVGVDADGAGVAEEDGGVKALEGATPSTPPPPLSSAASCSSEADGVNGEELPLETTPTGMPAEQEEEGEGSSSDSDDAVYAAVAVAVAVAIAAVATVTD